MKAAAIAVLCFVLAAAVVEGYVLAVPEAAKRLYVWQRCERSCMALLARTTSSAFLYAGSLLHGCMSSRSGYILVVAPAFLLTRLSRCLCSKEHIACSLALMGHLGRGLLRVHSTVLVLHSSQRGCYSTDVSTCCQDCKIFLCSDSIGHFIGSDSPISVALLLQAGVPLRLLQRTPLPLFVSWLSCIKQCGTPNCHL